MSHAAKNQKSSGPVASVGSTYIAGPEGSTNFKVERDAGVAVVTFDLADEPVNTLSLYVGAEFEEVLAALQKDKGVQALVFRSAKKDSFVAGANIEMLNGAKTAGDGEALSRSAQAVFNQLAKSQKPVVAAIHGSCLGGGLEWALACQYRIASDDPKTQLGLPEVQLGVIPGAGGTQRLPRLIGIAAALDLILTGKTVRAKKAKALGIVDEVVPAAILLQVSKQRARALAEGKLKPAEALHGLAKLRQTGWKGTADPKVWQEALLEENPLGRELLFRKARAELIKKSRGNYPAPEAALEVVRVGIEKGFERGLAEEAKRFGDLVVSEVAQRLMAIFFAQTALKKDAGVDDASVKPRAVKRVGVLGGGLMGGGIAFVTLQAGLPVRIRERDDAGVARGLAHVKKLIDERVTKKAMSSLERDQMLRLLTATTGWAGYEGVDLVIEAVFEDLKIKQEVLKAFEAQNPRAIFATNTSTIPLSEIGAVAKRPELVVGMHYFSPVEKMPLLEVIRTDRTSAIAVATAVAVGKKQGKTCIVVKDAPGFYVNRILGPYLDESIRLLEEGVAIVELDRAIADFGFPVGPIQLLDEVGLDVASKACSTLHKAFPERVSAPTLLDKMVADGRLGKKSGKGFYLYEGEGKGEKAVDPDVYKYLGSSVKPGKARLEQREIAERVALRMVAEAIRTLSEGIVRSPRDGDIGALFGIGFPPFRGGPFRYADTLRAQNLLAALEQLRVTHGDRFAAPQLLVTMAREQNSFY